MAKRKWTKKKTITSTGNKKFRQWDEYEKGDVIVGRFIQTQSGKFQHDNVIIEPLELQIEDTDWADEVMEAAEDGARLVLNGCGSLTTAIDDLEEEGIYEFTYNGKNKIKSGDYKGKMSHLIEVSEVEDPDADDEDDSDEEDSRSKKSKKKKSSKKSRDEDEDEDEDDEDEDEEEERRSSKKKSSKKRRQEEDDEDDEDEEDDEEEEDRRRKKKKSSKKRRRDDDDDEDEGL